MPEHRKTIDKLLTVNMSEACGNKCLVIYLEGGHSSHADDDARELARMIATLPNVTQAAFREEISDKWSA